MRNILLVFCAAVALSLCGCTPRSELMAPALPEPVDRESFIEQIDKNPKRTEEYLSNKNEYERLSSKAPEYPGVFEDMTKEYTVRLQWIKNQSMMVSIRCSEVENTKKEPDLSLDQPEVLPEFEEISNPIEDRSFNIGDVEEAVGQMYKVMDRYLSIDNGPFAECLKIILCRA